MNNYCDFLRKTKYWLLKLVNAPNLIMMDRFTNGMTRAAETEILNNLGIYEIKNTPSDIISTHSAKLCIIIIQP